MRCSGAILALLLMTGCALPPSWNFPEKLDGWTLAAPPRPAAMPPEFGVRKGECRQVRYSPPAVELTVCRFPSSGSAFEVMQSFRPTPNTGIVHQDEWTVLVRPEDPAQHGEARRLAQRLVTELRH
jgi:hypothetical protein